MEAYISSMAHSPSGGSPFDPQAARPTQDVKRSKALAASGLPPSSAPKASAPRATDIRRNVRKRQGLHTEPPKKAQVPTTTAPSAAAAVAPSSAPTPGRKIKSIPGLPLLKEDDAFAARITTYTGGSEGLKAWHYVIFVLACLGVAVGGYYFANGGW